MGLLEGPIVYTIAGFLTFTGQFSWWIALLILIPADVLPDVFYFLLGKYSHKIPRVQRYIDKSTFLNTHLDTMNSYWVNRPRITTLLGKSGYTLSIIIIISAGMSPLTLKQFMKHCIPVSILQISLLMALGYFMGNSYQALTQYIKYPFIIIGVFLFVFFFALRGVGKIATKQFDKKLPEETIEKSE